MDAFNRWLIEQYSIPLTPDQETLYDNDKYDPILPHVVALQDSEVMQREILKNIPAPTYVSWGHRNKPSQHTLKIFEEYLAKTEPVIDAFKADHPDLSLEKDPMLFGLFESCTKAISQINQKLRESLQNKVTPEIIAELLKDVQESTPFFINHYRPIVNEWYKLFSAKAIELVQRLNKPLPESNEVVKVRKDYETYRISYDSDSLTLLVAHYDKLRELYKIHSSEVDPRLDYFEERLYCLLRRYESCFGKQGAGFQAAAPETVFKFLSSHFGVCHETFASPLNCYYSRYNSAFPDTDGFFGSKGSFFDFSPIAGSFQLGTPNVEEVMNKAAERVEHLLENSKGPMSFIMFVPDWDNPPAQFLLTYGNSKYLKKNFLISGNDYCYIRGDQQVPSNSTHYFVAPFSSRVFILQNEEGYKKWPVTDSSVQSLKDAFAASKALKQSY
uniref:PCIF1 WW domain-containing protein n=1 Tax=Arcella intermedia TaxID=1963864 RepID=A0A6B2L391_9EUKA